MLERNTERIHRCDLEGEGGGGGGAGSYGEE